MRRRNLVRRRKSLDLLAVAVGLTVFGAQAFAASNTVPAGKAGDGQGDVSGYVLSSVKYNTNATTASNVDSVTFTLDSTPASGTVIKAQLSPSGAWYTCSNTAANVTCGVTSPQATVAGVTDLRVVIG